MANGPDVAEADPIRRWVNSVIVTALIFILADIISHIFIWTYLAEEPGVRNSMTACVTMSAAGGALFALLTLKATLTRAMGEWGQSESHMRWAMYLLVAVFAVWAVRLREEVVTWGSCAKVALVLAPLCTLLFSGVRQLGIEFRREGIGLLFSATIGGVVTGYAILGEPGNVWSTAAFLGVLWGTSTVVRGKPEERREVETIRLLALGFIGVVALHAMFNTLPIWWDLAVVLVLTFSCAIVVRIAVRRESRDGSAQGSLEEAREHANGPRLSRVAVWELLLPGWIALVFVTFAWTEATPVMRFGTPLAVEVSSARAWNPDTTWKELFAEAPVVSGRASSSARHNATATVVSEGLFRVVTKTLGWIVLMFVTVYAFRGWVKQAKSIVERVRGGIGEEAISKNREINWSGRLERRDLMAAGVGELRRERAASVGKRRRIPAWAWWLYGCGMVAAVGLIYVFSPKESSNSKYYSCVLGQVWDDPELSRINGEIDRLRRYATGLASERDPLVRAVEGRRFMGATGDLETLEKERLSLCRRLYWSGNE